MNDKTRSTQTPQADKLVAEPSSEIRRLAAVAVAECPPGPLVADWMDCAMRVCRALATLTQAAPAAPVKADAGEVLTDAQIESLVYEICPDFDDAHEGISMSELTEVVRAALSQSAQQAAPVVHPPGFVPGSWVDDPHDIEHGMIFRPCNLCSSPSECRKRGCAAVATAAPAAPVVPAAPAGEVKSGEGQ